MNFGRVFSHFEFKPIGPNGLDVPEGQLGATVGPNSSIRTLYVYWGLHFEFKQIGAKVWTFLRDRPLPSNVQRALCTVKAVSKTYRLPSARLRIAGAPISIHILGSWSPYAPNGTFRPRPPCLGICKRHARSQYFIIIRTISSPHNSRCV